MIRAEAERVLVSVWGALREAPGLKSADLLAALGTRFPETATGVLRGEGDAEIGLLWAGRSAPQAFSPHDLAPCGAGRPGRAQHRQRARPRAAAAAGRTRSH